MPVGLELPSLDARHNFVLRPSPRYLEVRDRIPDQRLESLISAFVPPLQGEGRGFETLSGHKSRTA